MFKKGRAKRFGKNNGRAKLTDAAILDIRQKYSTGEYSQRKLAHAHEVNQKQIWRIVNNEHWKHLNNSTQV